MALGQFGARLDDCGFNYIPLVLLDAVYRVSLRPVEEVMELVIRGRRGLEILRPRCCPPVVSPFELFISSDWVGVARG